ncbi:MAG TPA: hypothetical protein VFJ83_04295 [Nocardioidaceae bacterium]|nr:hypothetical protein [Nocardioidaceae bacterium]
MTRLVARAVLWLAVLAVIVVAGGHFVYYLLEWEWSRASIAGVGFVGALVLGSSFLFLTRLLAVERRLDQVLVALEGLERGAPASDERRDDEPRPDFPWLRSSSTYAVGLLALAAVITLEPPDQGVFIPVFLAAGLVISAVAGAVERVAAARHGGRVAAAATPRPVRAATEPLPTAREVLAARPAWSLAVIPVIGAVATGLVVWGLYLGSHYWSKPVGPGITTMTVEVEDQGFTTSDIDVVETVGRFCALDTGTQIRFREVDPGPGESTLLRLSPLLDKDAQNRYIGCVEDAVLEFHQLTVTGTVLAPRQ